MTDQLVDADFSHLAPPQEANNIQHDPKYIHFVKENNYHVRKIFYEVDYSDYENQKIDEFEQHLKTQGIQMPKEWDRAKSLKYCLTGQMQVDKSIEVFNRHVQWLNDPFSQKIGPKALEFLNDGLVYQSGRDKQYRPIIYLNVKKFNTSKYIDEQLQAISNLLVRVKKHMWLKGKIENQIVILDLSGVSMLRVPLDLIQKIIKTIITNFTCSLHKMFLLNPPTLIRLGWSGIKKFMVEETAKKINMLAEDDYSQLQEFINKDQLQQKYSGTIPNITQYWPPQSTYKEQAKQDTQQLTKQQSYQQQGEEEESIYYSIMSESKFFNNGNNQDDFSTQDQDRKYGAININDQDITFLNNGDLSQQHKGGCCQCSIF